MIMDILFHIFLIRGITAFVLFIKWVPVEAVNLLLFQWTDLKFRLTGKLITEWLW